MYLILKNTKYKLIYVFIQIYKIKVKNMICAKTTWQINVYGQTFYNNIHDNILHYINNSFK